MIASSSKYFIIISVRILKFVALYFLNKLIQVKGDILYKYSRATPFFKHRSENHIINSNQLLLHDMSAFKIKLKGTIILYEY